jgi:hypothetical protein
MATRSPSGALDFVRGTFAYHGGTITTLNAGANCTNQQYLVSDRLRNVATSTTWDGFSRPAERKEFSRAFRNASLKETGKPCMASYL